MKRMSAPPSSKWVARQLAASAAGMACLPERGGDLAAEHTGVESRAIPGEEEGFGEVGYGHDDGDLHGSEDFASASDASGPSGGP
jgi:hypothetical protein